MIDEAQQQLIRLASDNLAIYENARQWFAEHGRSTVPTLIHGLEDDALGSVAQWRVLLLLREFGLVSTLPAIVQALKRSLRRGDPIVLPGAMEAVAVFPASEAVPALELVINSGYNDAVKHAAALLGNIGGDRAIHSLESLLKHSLTGIRKSAAEALLKINTRETRDILYKQRAIEQDPGILRIIQSAIE